MNFLLSLLRLQRIPSALHFLLPSLMSSDASSSSAPASAASIIVHPLVVLSISDHFTRSYQQFGVPRVFGLLFGEQTGQSVAIRETVEFSFAVNEEPTARSINFTALEADMKLFQTCYPSYECLGWYRSGELLEGADEELQGALRKYNESPLFLLFNTKAARPGDSLRDLPIVLFEEFIHVLGERSARDFRPANFLVQAEEGERITVVHCAKLGNKKDGESELIQHFSAVERSIVSLNDRIRVLIQYLRAVEEGQVPRDPGMLREVKSLLQRLPTAESDKFHDEFLKEFNESLLLSYLAATTKGAAQLARLNEKFQLSVSKKENEHKAKRDRHMPADFAEERERHTRGFLGMGGFANQFMGRQ